MPRPRYSTGETQIAGEVLYRALRGPLSDYLRDQIWEPLDYGYLWWTTTSEAGRRDKAFAGEGIHGQFLYINPAVNVVIVVWSARPEPEGGEVVSDWAFFGAVSEALRERRAASNVFGRWGWWRGLDMTRRVHVPW